MMCATLLARAGLDVTVLEKHADFLRDFRGDTVHPSTLEVMRELGLLEDFLKLPHSKIRTASLEMGDRRFTVGEFARLPTTCKFIALMPQWDFLDFLAGRAKRLPNFHLLMQTQATELIEQDGRICGLKALGPQGAFEIKADLTIAADRARGVVRVRVHGVENVSEVIREANAQRGVERVVDVGVIEVAVAEVARVIPAAG